MPEGDGQHDGEGGPRVDAQHAGLGERVAGERLHDDAGGAERRAHHDGHCGAGQTQLPDDDRGGAPVVGEEPLPHLAERQWARADGHADKRQKYHDGESQEHDESRSATAFS